MNAERVTNKTLNHEGWYWAVKFDNVADADAFKATLPMGTKQYYLSKGNSAKPHWILIKRDRWS